MTHTTFWRHFATIPLLAMLFASCGDKEPENLADCVGSKVSVATIADIEEILRNAGVPLSDSAEPLDSVQTRIISLATNSIMTDELSALVAAGAVDPSEILSIRLIDKSEALGVKILDESAFETAAADHGFAGSYISRGDLRFVADNTDAVLTMLDSAIEDQSASIVGTRNFLAGDGSVCAAIHYQPAGNEAEWVTARFNVTDTSISVEASAYDKDGGRIAVGDNFGEIDQTAFSFVPTDAVLVAAFGKPNRGFVGLDKILKEYAGLSSANLNGTSVFSLSLAGSVDNLLDAGPEAFNLQLVTAAGDDGGDAILRQALARYGGAKESDGQYLARFQGCDLWLGVTDGYLAQSLNRPVYSAYNNSIGSVFEGKRMGVSVEIPFGSPLISNLRLPAGLSLTFTLGSDSVKGRMRFYGSTKPAAVTFAEFDRDFAEWIVSLPAMLI